MLIRSYVSVTVVSNAATSRSGSRRNSWSARQLSFPPLQQNSTGSATPSLPSKSQLYSTENLSPQGRITQRILILLIQEILCAQEKCQVLLHAIGCRQIKPRVPGIACQPNSNPQELKERAIRSRPGEIAHGIRIEPADTKINDRAS